MLIPFSLAWAEVAGDLPVQYFDPHYVRLMLASRIELLIVEQSQLDPRTKSAIHSCRRSESLVKLNEICRKRNVLTGLGDLDLLQLCDIERQYQRPVGYVLVGQTFDRKLSEALTLRSGLVESASVRFGEPDTERQMADFVGSFFKNPFEDADRRLSELNPAFKAFVDTLFEVCSELQACS